jgi:hypothetical protein
MDILSGATPLIVDVRQSGSGPSTCTYAPPECYLSTHSTLASQPDMRLEAATHADLERRSWPICCSAATYHNVLKLLYA